MPGRRSPRARAWCRSTRASSIAGRSWCGSASMRFARRRVTQRRSDAVTTPPAKAPPVAIIDEQRCIGCTLCIEACPVDAIVGAARLMHTVIAAECTGCRLCVPPCPVDCIAMVETGAAGTHEERARRAGQYRRRHEARAARLERERRKAVPATEEEKKRAAVTSAMQRARQRLAGRGKREG